MSRRFDALAVVTTSGLAIRATMRTRYRRLPEYGHRRSQLPTRKTIKPVKAGLNHTFLFAVSLRVKAL